MIENISAIGNAHQIASSLPVRERRYATGRSTTSCLVNETSIEESPLPRACNDEIMIISKPAKKKCVLIIRRAVTPMLSILSLASKSFRSCAGKICIMIVPTIMIDTEYIMAYFIAPVIRFFFLAP